jgi:hypothetical protein
MTAPSSIDPALFLHEQLASASPPCWTGCRWPGENGGRRASSSSSPARAWSRRSSSTVTAIPDHPARPVRPTPTAPPAVGSVFPVLLRPPPARGPGRRGADLHPPPTRPHHGGQWSRTNDHQDPKRRLDLLRVQWVWQPSRAAPAPTHRQIDLLRVHYAANLMSATPKASWPCGCARSLYDPAACSHDLVVAARRAVPVHLPTAAACPGEPPGHLGGTARDRRPEADPKPTVSLPGGRTPSVCRVTRPEGGSHDLGVRGHVGKSAAELRPVHRAGVSVPGPAM